MRRFYNISRPSSPHITPYEIAEDLELSVAEIQKDLPLLDPEAIGRAYDRLNHLKSLDNNPIPSQMDAFSESLEAYTECLAEYYDSCEIPQLTEVAQTLDKQPGLWDKTKAWVSFGLDLLPIISQAKSFTELISGIDPVTRKPVSRWMASAVVLVGVIPGAKCGLKIGSRAMVKALEKAAKRKMAPTYKELTKVVIPNKKGNFEVHHILPKYLGRMLGYTEKQMRHHPGIILTKVEHTGAGNLKAYHKVIGRYLPRTSEGQTMAYTAEQIRKQLKAAYTELGVPELYNVIKDLIK